MASQPPKNRERAYRKMMRKAISILWKGQLYNAAHIPAGQPTGRKASYIQIAREDLQRLDLFKTAQFLRTYHNKLPLLRFRILATSYIPSHLHLSNTATFPHLTNGSAPRVFPCKSWEMRFTPSFMALTSLHSPNQLKAFCSTSDNSIFEHGPWQPTQTPKK